MSDFFQTPMGRRFYEGTMPRLVKALETIAEKLDVKKEEKFVLISWDESRILGRGTERELRQLAKEMGIRGELVSSDESDEAPITLDEC